MIIMSVIISHNSDIVINGYLIVLFLKTSQCFEGACAKSVEADTPNYEQYFKILRKPSTLACCSRKMYKENIS